MSRKIMAIITEGKVSKDFVVPKNVVDDARFTELCQREYDRQQKMLLEDKLAKAEKALGNAIEKGKTAEERMEKELARDNAKARLDAFKSELAEREADLTPTKDRIAIGYVWAMCKMSGDYNLTDSHDLFAKSKEYMVKYEDVVDIDKERQKSINDLKASCASVLGSTFNSDGSNPVYKKMTLKPIPTWMLTSVLSAVYGRLAPKNGVVVRQFAKEVDFKKQLVLAELKALGVEEDK